MGNSNLYENARQQAIRERQNKIEDQMATVRESFQKFNITYEKALQISSLNVHEAVKKFNENLLTSEALLAALIYRCNTVGREFNFCTATNYAQSIQVARDCDEKRKELGKKNWTFEDGQYDEQKYFPPLFGIPISVKDVFHVDTMTTTVGLCCRAQHYEPESPLIKCFKNSGMIPFIKTNVPQFGMTCQTNNILWGRTVNPWNKKRSVGGSSGGQGAIISARCSLIGVGSDIGGSIRIPSQFCGLFGLKAYSKRISGTYHAIFNKASHSFSQNIPICLGPMGKSARDLALFMDVVTNQQFYGGEDDPYTKIIPFNAKQYLQTEKGNKKWRIGIIKSLKDIEPSHASRRAIQQTIDLLKKEGHQVFEIQIPNEKQILIEFVGEYGANKIENFRDLLKGEKPVSQYKSVFQIGQMWGSTRFLLSTISKKFMPRLHTYFLQNKPYSKVIQYQRHVGQICQLKSKWINFWRENKLDFAICPGLGCQAFPNGKSQKLSMACFYTVIWNVLDMTTGSVPITVVKQDQQIYQSAFNDLITKQLREVAWESQGLPVGIQVIGLPYQQERVLGFMSYLEQRVKFYQKNPLPNI